MGCRATTSLPSSRWMFPFDLFRPKVLSQQDAFVYHIHIYFSVNEVLSNHIRVHKENLGKPENKKSLMRVHIVIV